MKTKHIIALWAAIAITSAVFWAGFVWLGAHVVKAVWGA